MSTLSEDCEAMDELFSRATELDKQAKAIRAEARQLEAQLLERMAQERCSSHAVDGGKLYTKAETIYAVVQDAEVFAAWAETHDERLIKMKPDGELLNGLVRTRLDNGEELPPGVGFYPKEYISKKAR